MNIEPEEKDANQKFADTVKLVCGADGKITLPNEVAGHLLKKGCIVTRGVSRDIKERHLFIFDKDEFEKFNKHLMKMMYGSENVKEYRMIVRHILCSACEVDIVNDSIYLTDGMLDYICTEKKQKVEMSLEYRRNEYGDRWILE